MSQESKRRHVFISHHHKDDEHVTKMTSLLNKSGYDLRNSSIRAKPSNQNRLDKNLIPEATLKRLLRMKMSWASTVVVLIGKDTHKRPWVNWEIKMANELGKQIVGVFTRGGTQEDVPPAFEKYGGDLVAWNSESILQAIDGTRDGLFQNPEGVPRPPTSPGINCDC